MKTTEIDGVTYAVAQPPTRWQDDFRARHLLSVGVIGLGCFFVLLSALDVLWMIILYFMVIPWRTGDMFILEDKTGLRWRTTGRLWVEDGLLKFASPDVEWQLRRSDILGRREGRDSMIITLTRVGDRPLQEFRIGTQFKFAEHASKIGDEGESIRPPLFAPDYVREKTPSWIYGLAVAIALSLTLLYGFWAWQAELIPQGSRLWPFLGLYGYILPAVIGFWIPLEAVLLVRKVREREILAAHELEGSRDKLMP